MSQPRNRSQKNFRKRQKRNKKNQNFMLTKYQPLYNSASLVIPNECDVQLRFYDQVVLTAAAQFVGRRFNPNCAYDVDPTLGSTSTAGFSEMAALFLFYRVISYSYHIEVANKEAFPVSIFVVNTNADPGTTATSYWQYLGNQFSTFKTVASLTGSPSVVSFRGGHTVSQIVGSHAPETADNFASLTNTVPADKIFLAVGADTLGGPNLTNGVAVSFTITMRVRFYERKTLTS